MLRKNSIQGSPAFVMSDILKLLYIYLYIYFSLYAVIGGIGGGVSYPSSASCQVKNAFLREKS